MKIGNSVGPTGVPTPQGATTKPAAQAGTASASSGTGDAVHLSALSSQLQSADAVMSSVPVVNRAQVDEIKKAISEGRFKVNPEVVADKVLDSVRELIRNKTA